ncbi:sigma-70 family RNA polymerase sigma factor [bacterium]|nr:sigma-70 family RNA polymerase sigma factor [bacterium]
MLQQEEQQKLIEKFVTENAYFQGNEDLQEEFCKEAYNKAYLILSTSDNIQKAENFVSKIVNTTMISILKQKQRYKKAEVTASKEDTSPAEEKVSFSEGDRVIKYDFPDPVDTTEDIEIKRELLQNITDTVCIIHKEIPSKLLYDIFYLRYLKKKTQNEISKELNIPQGEVCKRLLHLSKLISAYLYKR